MDDNLLNRILEAKVYVKCGFRTKRAGEKCLNIEYTDLKQECVEYINWDASLIKNYVISTLSGNKEMIAFYNKEDEKISLDAKNAKQEREMELLIKKMEAERFFEVDDDFISPIDNEIYLIGDFVNVGTELQEMIEKITKYCMNNPDLNILKSMYSMIPDEFK